MESLVGVWRRRGNRGGRIILMFVTFFSTSPICFFDDFGVWIFVDGLWFLIPDGGFSY